MPQSDPSLTALILAAGMGTRMKSKKPKVMHPVAGRPMVGHVLDRVTAAGAGQIAVVVGPDMVDVRKAVAPHPCYEQVDRLGTAHAVLAAADMLSGSNAPDDVLVVFGDTPLLKTETLTAMVETRRQETEVGVVVLGFEPVEPGAYGRLILNGHGELERIVEAKDASPDELAVGVCNAGVMLIDGRRALDWLQRIGNDNAKGEFYLTDIVAMARSDGAKVRVVTGAEEEVLGVNSRLELAEAERIFQARRRQEVMAGGVTLVDPETVYLASDTVFGRDVTVGPNVFFGPGVEVADDVEIRAFCHIEGAKIGPSAVIGPFARLRPGADLAADVHIGNFVEVKNAVLGAGSKANHLSYVGDAKVGTGVNIGAGTITCNYDGYFKSQTVIEDGAFIGSNTALVAPVTVGAGAIVGAGSTIAKPVAQGALSLTRAPQKALVGWAERFNRKRAAEKATAKKDA